jgi:hypothetical protein
LQKTKANGEEDESAAVSSSRIEHSNSTEVTGEVLSSDCKGFSFMIFIDLFVRSEFVIACLIFFHLTFFFTFKAGALMLARICHKKLLRTQTIQIDLRLLSLFSCKFQ